MSTYGLPQTGIPATTDNRGFTDPLRYRHQPSSPPGLQESRNPNPSQGDKLPSVTQILGSSSGPYDSNHAPNVSRPPGLPSLIQVGGVHQTRDNAMSHGDSPRTPSTLVHQSSSGKTPSPRQPRYGGEDAMQRPPWTDQSQMSEYRHSGGLESSRPFHPPQVRPSRPVSVMDLVQSEVDRDPGPSVQLRSPPDSRGRGSNDWQQSWLTHQSAQLSANDPSAKHQSRVVQDGYVPGEGEVWVYADGSHCPKRIGEEDVIPQWGVTKAGKPRKRLAVACMTCREKKIKCDPESPKCVQCEKSGKPCRYEAT